MADSEEDDLQGAKLLGPCGSSMDIRQLRCFLAAAERLNFTRAAADLFMTQSGVSYQVAALEDIVGVPLFHRTSRGLRLTEAGAFYHQAIRDMMASYDEVLLKTRLLGTEVSGSLAIGVLGGFEKKLLPGWLDAFSQHFPRVEVKLSHHKLNSLVEALESGEVDLGFTMLFEGECPPNLESHTLILDHSVVVMRPDHPLASRKSLLLADLKDQAFVAMDAELGSRALEWRKKLCRKRGFTMHIVQSLPSFATLFMAVEAGAGISIHAQQVVEENGSPRLHLVPLEDEDCRAELAVIWRRNSNNPNVPFFLQTMGLAG